MAWARRLFVALMVIGWSALVVAVAVSDTGADALAIRVINDTPGTVELHKCDHGPSCGAYDEDEWLASGSSYLTNVSGSGGVQWFSLLREDGATLGCLRVEVTTRTEGLKYYTSSAKPCE